MDNRDLMQLLVKRARAYCPVALVSVARNDHMNELTSDTQPTQAQAEAIVVDFVNYIGMQAGMDMGMYTCDVRAAHPAPTAPEVTEEAGA